MRRLGDNFSTLTAPFVIVLTFGQTLGSLLDLECPWPNLLREWMQMLDIFNINLELALRSRFTALWLGLIVTRRRMS